VLRTLAPIEREIQAQSGAWYIRRILPYRTQDNGWKASSSPLPTSPSEARGRRAGSGQAQAELRPSRNHDFSPPRAMTSASRSKRLHCFRGCWRIPSRGASTEAGRTPRWVVGCYDGMLNTLLDINQLEVGTIRAEMVSFRIKGLLDRLRDEFTYHAQAQRLTLRVVSCGLSIHSDPRLLEQMIRNLLANALKYTNSGKVLLGCRRRQGILSIEIWDTGVGILRGTSSDLRGVPSGRQSARERSRGLGLGLSIVQRLGNLLAIG